MATKNITEYIKGLVGAAVEEHAGGDAVDWDVAMVIQQQGPPIYFISLTIPSSILGNYQQGGMVMPDWHQISQDSISVNIRTALEQLRQARSEALTGELKVVGDNNTSPLLAK